MTEQKEKKQTGVIRPMVRADITPIVLIEAQVFTDPWPVAAFEEELGSDYRGVLVAEIDGVITGYAGYIVVAGECQLTNIGVAPEFRGKSIAKSLLNCILEIARKADCEYIFLDVRPSNTAAINLYNRFGFVELYRRSNYYRIPPEDAVVMVRALRNQD